MANLTKAQDYAMFQASNPTDGILKLAVDISSTATSLTTNFELVDETGSAPTLNSFIALTNSENITEVMRITAVSGTTLTVVRGIARGGIDYAGSASNATTHKAGEVIKLIPYAGLLKMLLSVLLGSIATGGLDLIMGDATDGTATIKQLKSGSTVGWIRNNVALGKVQFSNDGTTWVNLDNAGVGALTAGNAINATQLALGIVEVNPIEDTNVFVSTSSGASDENKAPLLNSEGKLDKNFILVGTEIEAGENLTANNLVAVESDGKVYKTVNSHSAFAQIESRITYPSSYDDNFVLALDTDKNVMIWQNASSYLTGQVVSTSRITPTYGTELALVSATTNSLNGCVLATNKFVCVYKLSGDNKAYAVVCTVSGTTITAGTPVKVYDSDTVQAGKVGVCKLDTDKFLVTFHGATSDDPIAVACTVSGTTITAGSGVALEAVTMNASGVVVCQQIATDRAIVAYDDGTNVSTMVLSVSGTTITTNTVNDLYAGYISTYLSGKENFLIVNEQKIYFLNIIITTQPYLIVSVLNNYDTGNNDVLGYTATGNYIIPTKNVYSVFFPISITERTIGVISHKSDPSPYIPYLEIFQLNEGGAVLLDSYTLTGVSFQSISGNKLTDNKFFVYGRDDADSNKVKASIVYDTRKQFLGVVKTTTTAGNDAPIITHKDTAQTGLTAGTVYYAGDAGEVATTGHEKIGVGISTTNLYLN